MSIQPDVRQLRRAPRASPRSPAIVAPTIRSTWRSASAAPSRASSSSTPTRTRTAPSPLVQETLSTYSAYNVYPDAAQRTARALLSEYVGVPAEPDLG